jgi:hypothetical protein
MEFWLAPGNVYKVFAQTHSMYMEFWLALGNVYKVLMATIEHPLPMSWAPQDGDCFVRARSKVNMRNLITVKSPEQFHNFDQVSFLFTLKLFRATTFNRTTGRAVAQCV